MREVGRVQSNHCEWSLLHPRVSLRDLCLVFHTQFLCHLLKLLFAYLNITTHEPTDAKHRLLLQLLPFGGTRIAAFRSPHVFTRHQILIGAATRTITPTG